MRVKKQNSVPHVSRPCPWHRVGAGFLIHSESPLRWVNKKIESLIDIVRQRTRGLFLAPVLLGDSKRPIAIMASSRKADRRAGSGHSSYIASASTSSS